MDSRDGDRNLHKMNSKTTFNGDIDEPAIVSRQYGSQQKKALVYQYSESNKSNKLQEEVQDIFSGQPPITSIQSQHRGPGSFGNTDDF